MKGNGESNGKSADGVQNIFLCSSNALLLVVATAHRCMEGTTYLSNINSRVSRSRVDESHGNIPCQTLSSPRGIVTDIITLM